jgi:hypothetical protein
VFSVSAARWPEIPWRLKIKMKSFWVGQRTPRRDDPNSLKKRH